MGLQRYQSMRDFSRTPEPRGAKAAAKGKSLAFTVQRHDARRLHYDFRLELEGVLKSWAVPKGPSLDPKVRRGRRSPLGPGHVASGRGRGAGTREGTIAISS
jgi:bifunctional non-homologous end joining protein LigD